MSNEPCLCLFCGVRTSGSRGGGNVWLANVCQDCRDGLDASELVTPAGRPGARATIAQDALPALPPGLDGDHGTLRAAAFVAGPAANDRLPLVSVGPGGIGHEFSTEIGGAANAG